MKVWWSERARSQVRKIFEFIAQDRPSAAERILEGFLQRADLITESPDQGAAWGDPRRTDLRSIVFEGYRVGTDEIAILSVRDTRMQQTEGEV